MILARPTAAWSVYGTAKVLGVARPPLSKLLNGSADLSDLLVLGQEPSESQLPAAHGLRGIPSSGQSVWSHQQTVQAVGPLDCRCEHLTTIN
jgi:hypothetical protein